MGEVATHGLKTEILTDEENRAATLVVQLLQTLSMTYGEGGNPAYREWIESQIMGLMGYPDTAHISSQNGKTS